MLVTGIILLLLGAVVAYLGRGREQLIFYAGAIIFVIGVVFIIIYFLTVADANTNVDVALFTPLAWLLRKAAGRLDGQDTVIIPPGGYVFWSYAPTPSSRQWKTVSGTNTTPLPPLPSNGVDLN